MNREVHVRFSEGLGLKCPGLLDTAIPELLATLALEGTIVTIDAMGTQTQIAHAIRKRGADYVLCVKDNHPKLVESILPMLAGVAGPIEATTHFEERDKPGRHGRTEIRRCWAYDAVSHLHKHEQWDGLKSFAVVERSRTVDGKTSVERQFYISSLPADAKLLAGAVRSHWQIENRLHWCLDVQLNDDQSRARSGYAAHNLAVVRHIVLNLLRLDSSRKASIKSKRLLACSDDAFRAELLGLMT